MKLMVSTSIDQVYRDYHISNWKIRRTLKKFDHLKVSKQVEKFENKSKDKRNWILFEKKHNKIVKVEMGTKICYL